MPWVYKDGIIKRPGRTWKDEDGNFYPYFWEEMFGENKAAYGLTWREEDWVKPPFSYVISTNDITISVPSAAFINLKAIFDNVTSNNWAADIAKIANIASDVIIGPVILPSGMGGSLVINNAGTIIGAGGISNGGAGGHAITMNNTTTINNSGTISGGGGAGGNGGNGGTGGNSIQNNVTGKTAILLRGGIGGIGGSSAGVGAGYEVSESSGCNGAIGAISNAGNGGGGGRKGNGGALATAGSNGTAGNIGANGNTSTGSLGTSGTIGGAAGKAVNIVSGILTYNESGTTNGATN